VGDGGELVKSQVFVGIVDVDFLQGSFDTWGIVMEVSRGRGDIFPDGGEESEDRCFQANVAERAPTAVFTNDVGIVFSEDMGISNGGGQEERFFGQEIKEGVVRHVKGNAPVHPLVAAESVVSEMSVEDHEFSRFNGSGLIGDRDAAAFACRVEVELQERPRVGEHQVTDATGEDDRDGLSPIGPMDRLFHYSADIIHILADYNHATEIVIAEITSYNHMESISRR